MVLPWGSTSEQAESLRIAAGLNAQGAKVPPALSLPVAAGLNHIAQVARAVAFQLNVKLAEVEDDYNNAQAELTRRERTIYEHEEELRKQSALLALVRRDFPDTYRIVTTQVPPDAKPVNAVVAAVHPNPQGQQDLVALTVGRDDNVREGQEFSVYREGNYIVRVRVERVMNDMAFCRVLPTPGMPRS